MKIEKVNDNQIRCTLTKEDLASRKIKLSELAYGTEKAKSLFRDMMQQANYEFGFEAEDIPLMIEAIPLNADCIVLIITKVEDPEELDTRFSRFAPSVEDEVSEEHDQAKPEEPLDLFHQAITPAEDKAEEKPSAVFSRVFRFSSLEEVMHAASLIGDSFQGESTLYKHGADGSFLLLLSQKSERKRSFDKTCNLLSEYGTFCRSKKYDPVFLAEHCEVLIADNAISSLQ